MNITLSAKERKVRNILIRVAKGQLETHRIGLISYKELWELISTEKWGRARKNPIVSIITKISGYDLAQGNPPLNELVVVKYDSLPGEPWSRIKSYLEKEFKVKAPYKSHLEAQNACWLHWNRSYKTIVTQDEVEEGQETERSAVFKKRNRLIINKRKKLDNYKCQACGYKLNVNGKYIIDCHHTKPLGKIESKVKTHIEDLVCLCPNCHRIAHTRKFPLTVDEIKKKSP